MSTHSVKPSGTTLILEPKGKAATASVILCHGLGDTAHGWVDIAHEHFASAGQHIRFILPTAPTRPITLNGGMPMPGWYDIESLSGERTREKASGLGDSYAKIQALIAAENDKGIAASRIVLAGFSQGGALSLFSGLNHGGRLAGIVVMSGYMPRPGDVKPSPEALTTPVRFHHGDEDMVVPLAFARDAEKRVREMGASDVQFAVYEGLPHSADASELASIIAFLKEVLPPV